MRFLASFGPGNLPDLWPDPRTVRAVLADVGQALSAVPGTGWIDSGVLAGAVIITVVFSALALGLGLLAAVYHFAAARRRRQWARDTDRWRDDLMAVLSSEKAPGSLSATVADEDARRFLAFLVPYVTTISGPETRKVREVAQPLLPAVEKDLNASRAMIRAQAVYQIGLLGAQRRAPLLRKALEDESDYVVQVAVQRLARIGTPEDARRIIDCLDRLEDVDRLQLTSALTAFGPDVAPTFREYLRCSDTPGFTRIICAETLRWLSDPDSAPLAADLLRRGDGSAELAAALLRLLRRVGSARHAPVVRPYCSAETDFVRIHSARAIGRLGAESDAARLEDMVREDPSRWVALSAARALVELGQTTALRALTGADHERSSMAADLLPATA